MVVRVEPVACPGPVTAHNVFLGAEKAPRGHVVQDELKVVVIDHGLAELGQVVARERQRAQALFRDILLKVDVVAGVDEAVAVDHLAQRLGLVLQGVGAAEGEIVVHVGLTAVGGDTQQKSPMRSSTMARRQTDLGLCRGPILLANTDTCSASLYRWRRAAKHTVVHTAR